MNLEKIRKKIKKKVGIDVKVSEELHAIKLEGNAKKWEQVVEAGYIAAGSKCKGVINNILVDTIDDSISKPNFQSKALDQKECDVLIIGAGIVGCSIARELSKYKLNIILVEKEHDVAMHASSRNDGMIHPGFAPKIKSLKSKMNLRGNYLYDKISKDLDVEMNKTGSLILFDSYKTLPLSLIFNLKCKKIKLKSKTLLRKKLLKLEPNLTEKVKWGYYLPSAKVMSPYLMTVAYAENAVNNGAKLYLDTCVMNIIKKNKEITNVITNKGEIKTKVVINAAGTSADIIADMAGDRFYTIHPRKGEIALADKKVGKYFNRIAGMPEISLKSKSKGGGLIKTVAGNILIGPNAFEVQKKEDYTTSNKSLKEMINDRLGIVKNVHQSDIITYFAGTRAATYKEEFIIELSENLDNFIHVAGIQSPGFASAPAIAERVENIALEVLNKSFNVEKNKNYNPIRRKNKNLNLMVKNKRDKLIHENSDYGEIICRCEEISKGEIIDALNSPIKVDTVDGIKRRTRAGMGRCQGGFCMPLIMEIISEHNNLKMKDVYKKNSESAIVVKETK